MKRTNLAGTVALLVTVWAGPSFGRDDAEPGGASADAAAASSKEQFVEARRLFDDGQFEQALPGLIAVYEVTGSPNAQLYVARAHREMGRLVEAHRAMSETLKIATIKAAEDSKYEPTRIAAANELAILDTKVGKLVVAFADLPEGASVSMNGTPIAEADIGVPLAVLPGTVTIVATAPGKPEIRREEALAAGQTRTLALAFGQARPTPVAQQTPDGLTETHGGGVRTVGFVALGIGVAGMGMFGVTYAMAGGVESDLEEACHGQRCTDARFADDVDRGKTLDTLANVGLIVGMVGLLSGAAMVLLGGPTETAASGPSVGVGSDMAMATWRGSF